MKVEIEGDWMLEDEVRQDLAGAPDRELGRLRGRVAELKLSIEPIARTGKTLCQVTVRLANHVQVFACGHERDVRSAALKALRRARGQIAASMRRRRARLALATV